MYRVAVTGDRNWFCLTLARSIVASLKSLYAPDLVIVQGDCLGVDKAFGQAAHEQGVTVEEFLADWDKHGKAAGPIRNREMLLTKPNFVIACHRDINSSRGTRNCMMQALNLGIPVYLIETDEGIPRQIAAVRGSQIIFVRPRKAASGSMVAFPGLW